MKPMKRTTTALALAATCGLGALLLAAPASAESPAVDDARAPKRDGSGLVLTSATYAPADSGEQALTYDEELVPVGARGTVLSAPGLLGGTKTVLKVAGLVPNREYGAHVHANPCGPTGDDAGPHYQDVIDPVQPSTDPDYANPENEVWLDFVTDAHGRGQAVSSVPWQYGERRAGSVVIHEHHTHTGPDDSGEAGDRLACTTVKF